MRHSSYWELAVSTGRAPADLPSAVDVLIVGAGFMGRWLALFLQRSRPTLNVLVVERDLIGYGASTRNAGFLTTGQVTEMFQDSHESGFDSVLQLFKRRRAGVHLVRQEFPQLAIDPCGSIDFDPVTDEKREFASRIHKAVGATVFHERSVNLGGNTVSAFCQPYDAGVHPMELLHAIADAARGVKFAFGVKVRSLSDGNAIVELGDRTHGLKYGRAFVCTNAFAAELEPGSPVTPGRGQVIVTSPVTTTTSQCLGYLNAGYDYFRFVDGRLLLGGGRNKFLAQETTNELATTDNLLGHLKATAARVLGHSNFRVEHHWAGIMGFVGGKHIGGSPRRRIDACTEAIAGFGGMGVALTPMFAQEIAAQF